MVVRVARKEVKGGLMVWWWWKGRAGVKREEREKMKNVKKGKKKENDIRIEGKKEKKFKIWARVQTMCHFWGKKSHISKPVSEI